MSEKYYLDFKDYLNSCGINIVKSFDEEEEYKEPLSKDCIYKQLSTISKFHKLTMGISSFNSGLMENATGRKVERCKVKIKKLKRDISRFKENGPTNEFEKLVLDKGPEYLERAEKSIKYIYGNGYFGLIERSMKRNEICIGSTYIDNIREDKEINIRSLKKCCYNMVECDAVYFINKLRKRGTSFDFDEVIRLFCHLEGLSKDSQAFITAMVSFPEEFMKCCERYRYGKKEWNEDEYAKRLLEAIEKDGESLL
ncbi:MAG: hypothetical protein GX895_06495 [Clostridiales bacterium]|uniref:hypothetical protein n=1 Tax=Clostridium sp. N3C TaxID=1776758 RepID=UPI00092E126A|nr:hypothetical protein [Clostridium sp. N3C]NLZ48425.1 hypothetical protein [Clostridiales bacterium]SCN23820.1 spore coat protein, CotS family [Clostridium sp. N3C]